MFEIGVGLTLTGIFKDPGLALIAFACAVGGFVLGNAAEKASVEAAHSKGKTEGISTTLKDFDKAIETQEKNIEELEAIVESAPMTDEQRKQYRDYIEKLRKELEDAKKRRDELRKKAGEQKPQGYTPGPDSPDDPSIMDKINWGRKKLASSDRDKELSKYDGDTDLPPMKEMIRRFLLNKVVKTKKKPFRIDDCGKIRWEKGIVVHTPNWYDMPNFINRGFIDPLPQL